MPTMRAILVGAVESSAVALDAIAGHADWTLAAVATLDTAHSARHSDFVDLGPAAQAAGAAVLRIDNINREAALAAIGAFDADYIFVIGWSQICGEAFRGLADGRVIGYHPAALPRMRGRAAIPWTILSGDPITAGTLFWIDAGTDTGDLLDQHYFHVARDETAATLYAKHMRALSQMLTNSLGAIARGDIRREAQDDAYATWAARRTPLDGRIDWTAPADAVLRLIRASGRPYPGAFTVVGEDALHIWAARAKGGSGRHLARPGQIVAMAPDAFTVLCGDGSTIAVTEWSGARLRQHLQLGTAA
ncbi:Methionyl-tRNA formyltransferase [Sphingomonas sp. EC-HK361]|uniref:methionyl-tRNA formyltransferase n=1 Tax=Sphingomonas sp. EC-HK361 TaxID=2038397 RepID=UPI0012547811|nr:formyltransferase family protein [Sphingomonas sp. EC-HK361]VVT22538.1 Methionyl-tRNA formyltransferase [Sphingomonas sp. EC-HK361]